MLVERCPALQGPCVKEPILVVAEGETRLSLGLTFESFTRLGKAERFRQGVAKALWYGRRSEKKLVEAWRLKVRRSGRFGKSCDFSPWEKNMQACTKCFTRWQRVCGPIPRTLDCG